MANSSLAVFYLPGAGKEPCSYSAIEEKVGKGYIFTSGNRLDWWAEMPKPGTYMGEAVRTLECFNTQIISRFGELILFVPTSVTHLWELRMLAKFGSTIQKVEGLRALGFPGIDEGELLSGMRVSRPQLACAASLVTHPRPSEALYASLEHVRQSLLGYYSEIVFLEENFDGNVRQRFAFYSLDSIT